jgi:hypothetical protein
MTNMIGSKLSIFSHPGKITGYWITTRSFPYRGPYWHRPHGHFHIGLFIIPRPPYWPETQSSANMGRGMITRPIWKCPCIKLFVTYFRHLEKRHPYWPETKSILAWDEVHIGRCQYGPRYGNDSSEVPYINYFLTLIKHYFFSQFYNYKKNKSLQIKAFSKLKS